MSIQTNPLLLYVSAKPLFTEEEARLVYAAAGFYPYHLELNKTEKWLSEDEKPKSRLINGYFGYGEVMVFEYDQPFLGQKTQDFIETAKGNLIDFVFLSDEPAAVAANKGIYSSGDIRSVLTFAKMLVGIGNGEKIQSPDFLAYLQTKGFIAEEALRFTAPDNRDVKLSARQMFHDAYDYRVKYLLPSGVSLADAFDAERDVMSSFTRGASQPTEGHLAFTKEQARELVSEGKKAIFATQNIDIRDFRFIGDLCGGIVVCEKKEEGDAHLLDHLIGFPGLHFANGENGTQLRVRDGGLESGQVRLEYGAHVVLDTKGKRLITANASANTTEPYPEFSRLFLQACDGYRASQGDFKILANVSSFRDVAAVPFLGVDGVGLIRTEYFFLKAAKVACLRKVLVDNDPSALAALQEYQYQDFLKVFKALPNNQSFPITVRLLDPKPSELLTADERDKLRQRAKLAVDPRGVQILKTTPHLYAAQANAIFRAAKEVCLPNDLRILVPFVSVGEEMKTARMAVEDGAAQAGFVRRFSVGAMLETFSALTNIGDVVPHADFANVGPKDLTIEFLGGLREHQTDAIKTLLKERYGDKVPWPDERPYEHLHSALKDRLKVAL